MGAMCVPTKWAAPELLVSGTAVPTPASDIWSFGVLCWEVFTNCKMPHANVSSEQLRQGARLGQPCIVDAPQHCPGHIWRDGFAIVFQVQPGLRPSAAVLRQSLSRL